MKKFLSILLSGLAILGLVGCSSSTASKSDADTASNPPVEVKEETKEEVKEPENKVEKETEVKSESKTENKTVVEISSSEKEKIKSQVSEKLNDKNITSVDILTDSQTGKPMATVQLQGNIEKADINKEELESLSKEIAGRINTIVEKYTIEFIDKNYQLIMQNNNGTITYSE